MNNMCSVHPSQIFVFMTVCLVLFAQSLCRVLTLKLECLIGCKYLGFGLHVILEVDLYRLGQFRAGEGIIEDCAVNPGGPVRGELEDGDGKPSLLVLHLGGELCNEGGIRLRISLIMPLDASCLLELVLS